MFSCRVTMCWPASERAGGRSASGVDGKNLGLSRKARSGMGSFTHVHARFTTLYRRSIVQRRFGFGLERGCCIGASTTVSGTSCCSAVDSP